MTTLARRAAPGWGFAFAVGLLAALVGGWLIVTLASAGSAEAGWRHELICSALAALVIYLATWSQGRAWPAPAAVLASAQLLLLAGVLLLPSGRLEALGAVGVLVAVAAVAIVPLELRGSRGAPLPLVALVGLGLVELVAVTPAVVLLTLGGVLR